MSNCMFLFKIESNCMHTNKAGVSLHTCMCLTSFLVYDVAQLPLVHVLYHMWSALILHVNTHSCTCGFWVDTCTMWIIDIMDKKAPIT